MSTDVAARPVSAKAAWICLAIAWALFLVPLPGGGLFVGWPLNLVAFILAIVVMAKGSTQRGLWPLLASIVISPIVYFLGLAVLAGTAAGIAEANEPSASAAAMEAAAQAVPELTVSASELAAAYDQNEIAADARYKGKRVLISGTVEQIASDISDEPIVQLTGVNMFQSVHANGLSKADAAGLRKGEQISMACVGDGEMIGSPTLKECRLVQ